MFPGLRSVLGLSVLHRSRTTYHDDRDVGSTVDSVDDLYRDMSDVCNSLDIPIEGCHFQ